MAAIGIHTESNCSSISILILYTVCFFTNDSACRVHREIGVITCKRGIIGYSTSYCFVFKKMKAAVVFLMLCILVVLATKIEFCCRPGKNCDCDEKNSGNNQEIASILDNDAEEVVVSEYDLEKLHDDPNSQQNTVVVNSIGVERDPRYQCQSNCMHVLAGFSCARCSKPFAKYNRSITQHKICFETASQISQLTEDERKQAMSLCQSKGVWLFFFLQLTCCCRTVQLRTI